MDLTASVLHAQRASTSKGTTINSEIPRATLAAEEHCFLICLKVFSKPPSAETKTIGVDCGKCVEGNYLGTLPGWESAVFISSFGLTFAGKIANLLFWFAVHRVVW